MVSPLEQLTAASGRKFPNLLKARRLTSERLSERRARLADLPQDEDVSIVLMGSWGRSEITSGSDDDFMVLVGGGMREDIRPSKAEVEKILDRAPGDSAAFGEIVRLGKELEQGLLALLFETRSLPKLVRDYAIF